MIAEKVHDLDWQQFLTCRDVRNSKIKLISEMLEDRKIKLLGHIMRGSTEDPLYKMTFDNDGNRRAHATKHKRCLSRFTIDGNAMACSTARF